jgi:hypothetical protein
MNAEIETLQEMRDAIEREEQISLYRRGTQRTHSEHCWQWHFPCALRKIDALIKELK